MTKTASRMNGLGESVKSLISRVGWLARAGFFMKTRNLYNVFGYSMLLKHEDFVLKYTRQDIASRVIDAPVDATWTEPPEVEGGEAFNKAWGELVKTQHIFAYLRKTDIFAGLGQYAIMIVGFDDGRALDTPVNKGRSNKVIYFQPYLEGSVSITEYDENTSSPRFGQPIMYEVEPGTLKLTSSIATTHTVLVRKKFKVHYSRVLHLADRTLENNTFGTSRLEPVFNVLDDILKVAGGSAETYWLAGNRGLQVDVDKDMDLAPDDASDLEDEIEEYQHQLRRVIRTRGVTIKNLGSDVADPRGAFNVSMALLASATKIPQRILMGAEAGQLASQQDRANWAISVAERIANYAQPFVLIPFIQLLTNANALPQVINLTIKWPEAFKMNPLERAQTSAQQARSLVNTARAMQVAQEIMVDLVSVEEAREMVAPGKQLLVLTDTPKGTMPPSIKEVDPNKFAPINETPSETAPMPIPNR